MIQYISLGSYTHVATYVHSPTLPVAIYTPVIIIIRNCMIDAFELVQ